MSEHEEMHPSSRRAAEELLSEAERLLEGNESLSDRETIKAPAIFVDGVRELLDTLIKKDNMNKALNSQ
ncbi:hypothetical protein [Xanthomonas campestris]|uniref:hypothetical protein n=1 Tax=Xanthomonas campestris TaxID=339 RepID=UPI002379E872|nr:hypothetical protein [Xanthomonas campestris]WDJ75399.1 hypothetical protein JH282_13120 [Xanthomonas campestris pv. campestris]